MLSERGCSDTCMSKKLHEPPYNRKNHYPCFRAHYKVLLILSFNLRTLPLIIAHNWQSLDVKDTNINTSLAKSVIKYETDFVNVTCRIDYYIKCPCEYETHYLH